MLYFGAQPREPLAGPPDGPSDEHLWGHIDVRIGRFR